MTASEERAYVLQTFLECMEPYKDKKMALYGLGVNSEHLVLHQQGYRIVALLDSKRVGEVCFGLPVISAEDAIRQIDVVVIVAKNESIPIIYDRIAWMENEGMTITDIAGRKIVDKTDEDIAKEPYWQKNLNQLKTEIDKNEVITFDVFDTLLMRTILKPRDMFDVVGKIWCGRHPDSVVTAEEFALLREEAEQAAREKYDAFNYKHIYEFLEKQGKLTTEQLKELMELEFETEKRFLVPRYDMVKALEYARDSGKEVYLISDMYFTGKEIEVFLKNCGITGYHGLVVSSDAGCWKWPEGELFSAAIDLFQLKNKKVLHIGDNEGADWICGAKAGFEVYPVWSAYHMLEKSALKYLLVNARTLEDSCMLGIYAARCLNSPFALHEGTGRLYLKNEYEIGFAGYGALLTAYIHYLLKKYSGKENTKILFLARDGFLPSKLYELIVRERKIKDAPRGVYVLSSRRALSMPAIFDEEDLEEQLLRINSEVECGAFLKARFGVQAEENDAQAMLTMQGEELWNYLRKYKENILKTAEKERIDYLTYLETLGIDFEKETHILMDSATSGTSAYYWRKFVQPKAEMEAILLIDISNWSVYDMRQDRGFLGTDSKLLERKAYCRSEFLNDSILTAPDSQLLYMDGTRPIFSEEERKRSWESILKAQKGIIDFCMEYLDKVPWSVSEQEFGREFLDDCIRVLTEKSIVKEEIKDRFMVVEQFSGRMGEIQAWKK